MVGEFGYNSVGEPGVEKAIKDSQPLPFLLLPLSNYRRNRRIIVSKLLKELILKFPTEMSLNIETLLPPF